MGNLSVYGFKIWIRYPEDSVEFQQGDKRVLLTLREALKKLDRNRQLLDFYNCLKHVPMGLSIAKFPLSYKMSNTLYLDDEEYQELLFGLSYKLISKASEYNMTVDRIKAELAENYKAIYPYLAGLPNECFGFQLARQEKANEEI